MSEHSTTSVPIVDLRGWQGTPGERAHLVDEVRASCHEVGFLVLTRHGIPPTFLESLFAMMERLFALPDAEKAKIDKQQSRHFRGWEAVGSERTNNRPDIREQIDLWSEHRERAPDVVPAYLRLLGPNQWPDDAVLPGFRALLDEWFRRCEALARDLMTMLSLGLGLEGQTLNRMFRGECMSLTKLIHYPPTPSGGAGVNAHHDTGFLTLLAPGGTSGLEIADASGSWVPVPLIPNSFVMNLGEMMQALSGNYFVATPHRVITTDERYSAGYFHGPALDTALEPLTLGDEYTRAVAASPRHAGAGYMARKEETEAGVGDMQSRYRATVYGEQLWNYFARSYPGIMAAHYPDHP